MEYFFNKWHKIRKKLKSGKKIFLCLDYDGTLTPIVSKPELAKLDKRTKNILDKLSRNKKVILAIISGRPLEEVKKLVGLKNIIYAGNHGFEIETQITADGVKCHSERSEESRRLPQIFIQPVAKKVKPLLQKIKKLLNKKIKNIKGAFVEDKGLTLSIHWRLTSKKDLPNLFALIHETIRANSRVKLTRGKKVWEIRPNVDWHKGKAINYILSLVPRPSSLVPVFIGDDTTDEDAFKTLRNGITIRIGKSKQSKAKYYLKNQPEITHFLKELGRF